MKSHVVAGVACWGGLISFFIGIEVGLADGKERGRRESEHAAVLAGHAEYYLGNDFKRAWRWKEAK